MSLFGKKNPPAPQPTPDPNTAVYPDLSGLTATGAMAAAQARIDAAQQAAALAQYSKPSIYNPAGIPVTHWGWGNGIIDEESGRNDYEYSKETLTVPIVGYRVWKLDTSGPVPRLKSAAKNVFWPARVPLRRDLVLNEGIHALKSGQNILDYLRQYSADVVGEIFMWGRVEEFELGFLSEFAYPKRLGVRDSIDPVILMGLEDAYGVPVELRADLGPKEKNPYTTTLNSLLYGYKYSHVTSAPALGKPQIYRVLPGSIIPYDPKDPNDPNNPKP